MRSTGEVMGIDESFSAAYAKAALAAGQRLPMSGKVFITMIDKYKDAIVPIAKVRFCLTQMRPSCPSPSGLLSPESSALVTCSATRCEASLLLSVTAADVRQFAGLRLLANRRLPDLVSLWTACMRVLHCVLALASRHDPLFGRAMRDELSVMAR